VSDGGILMEPAWVMKKYPRGGVMRKRNRYSVYGRMRKERVLVDSHDGDYDQVLKKTGEPG